MEQPKPLPAPYPAAGLLPVPDVTPGLIPLPAGVTVSEQRLGNLSMKHETGYGPGQEAGATARVSTNKGDKGGVSYGAYQLASNYGQPQKFLRREGAQWADRFKGMDPTEFGGAFGKMWKTVAAENPTEFFEAQHAYIQRSHYNPMVARVLKRTGVDIDRQPQAIRDAAWSAAVNHSSDGATAILADGINNAKRLAPPGTPDFDIAALDLIYDRRGGYVRTLKKPPPDLSGLLNRYRLEHKNARGMLRRQ